jgi:hypothetical protein
MRDGPAEPDPEVLPRWIIDDESGERLTFDTDESLSAYFRGTPFEEEIRKAIAFVKSVEETGVIPGDTADGFNNVFDSGGQRAPVGGDCVPFTLAKSPKTAQLFFPLWVFGNTDCQPVKPYRLLPRTTTVDANGDPTVRAIPPDPATVRSARTAS